MKTMWITIGVGFLVTAVGGVAYVLSDHKYGVIVILSGMVLAGMGIVMRLVTAFMDERSRQKPS